MYDSPTSLLDLCLDCICDCHATIFSTCFVRAEASPSRVVHHLRPQTSPRSEGGRSPSRITTTTITSSSDSDSETAICQMAGNPTHNICQQQHVAPSVDDVADHRQIFVFPDPDFVLLNELSEKLLQRFDEKDMLNDSTLALFSRRNTRLRRVRMRRAKVTSAGLAILRQHTLTTLSCADVEHLTVGGVLHALSADTLSQLTHLNVAHVADDMSPLTRLKRLRSLNAAFTELDQRTLQLLCDDLPDLDALDLSGTAVRCLRPLLRLKHRLHALTLSDLRALPQMCATIIELDALRHLDVSLINSTSNNDSAAISAIFERPDCLPALTSLDISGWRERIPPTTLTAYLHAHPRLTFLGLVHNAAAFEVAPPVVRIAGLADEAQITCALRMYAARHAYVRDALYHLFQLSDVFATPRPDLVVLVTQVMRAHPSRFGAQMAATACLYNLTRGDLARHIHPRHLAAAVHRTLDAMDRFADEFQLQKNALLTLCSDRVLQDVRFDRYRCARLALDALCAFDDVHMNRMSVAICSILAAKISTAQTSALGARATYMRKLLAMVRARIDARAADVTLKFTLSALWNLTDESAPTCAVFLLHGGADLFMDVLRTFRADAAVETKVLGLLNNIAEVRQLRAHLMSAPLVRVLRTLLADELIDVSYFAAGIVAHLAADGDDAWLTDDKDDVIERDVMLVALEAAVLAWGVPVNEMVSYRSFRPFFPLLAADVDHRVQLWAVWAMHHVCTKNAARYCRMLEEENGVRFLEALVTLPTCHQMALAKCIEMLQQFAATHTQ